MARQTFENLSIVSEGNGFEIRTHVSCEKETDGGAPKVASDGVIIQYPISRVDGGRENETSVDNKTVDIAELIESMENAFKVHWDNHLQAPAHVSYPSLAYRVSIGLNHANSLEHANRWPSGVPTYRFDTYKADLVQAIDNASDPKTDVEVQRLLEMTAYANRWREEAKAVAKAQQALDI